MPSRRHSTVHDLTALRLHQDGSRVLNSDTNLSSRRAKYALRDARNNWIARDAGGVGTVKQRRSASQPDGDEEDEPEVEHEEPIEDVLESIPRKDKGKGRARESGDEEEEAALTAKAKKRLKYDGSLTFLDSGPSHTAVPPTKGRHAQAQDHVNEESPHSLSAPSSDLLKCLHHFASTYYTAMGQLYDAAREVRKQRKIRRLQQLSQAASSSRARSQSEVEARHDLREDIIHSSEDEADGEYRDGEEIQELSMEDGRKKQRRSRDARAMDKDMYRAFEGSALIALGMLLQEHVAEMLEHYVPGGWQEEMVLAEREKRLDAKRSRRATRMRDKRKLIGHRASQSHDEIGPEEGKNYLNAQGGMGGDDETRHDNASDSE